MTLPQPLPTISVVIPTTFRSTLGAAVNSVLAQEYPAHLIDLVIVADVSEDAHVPRGLPVPPLFTGGGAGGGSARELGARNAVGEWIAFLDDDDIWRPQKLVVQLAAVEATDVPTVVSCRFAEIVMGATSDPLPTSLCKSDQRIVDYLFRGRSATIGRPSIPTSSLLINSAAASAVAWNGSLRRHQDWDWLASFDRLPRRVFIQVPECLVEKSMGSVGSISASDDWEASLGWALSRKDQFGAHTFCDFVTAQPLRYALQARAWSGVRKAIQSVRSSRRFPSWGTLVFGLSGLLPRKTAERVLATIVKATAFGRRRPTGG